MVMIEKFLFMFFLSLFYYYPFYQVIGINAVTLIFLIYVVLYKPFS